MTTTSTRRPTCKSLVAGMTVRIYGQNVVVTDIVREGLGYRVTFAAQTIMGMSHVYSPNTTWNVIA